jgi:hypothetical protein
VAGLQGADELSKPRPSLGDYRRGDLGNLDDPSSQAALRGGRMVEAGLPGLASQLTLGGQDPLGNRAGGVPGLDGEIALRRDGLVGELLGVCPDRGRARDVHGRQCRPAGPGCLCERTTGPDDADHGIAALARLLLALAHPVLALANLLLPPLDDGEQLLLNFLYDGLTVPHGPSLTLSSCKLYQANARYAKRSGEVRPPDGRVGHDKASVGYDKASASVTTRPACRSRQGQRVGHDKASVSVTTRPARRSRQGQRRSRQGQRRSRQGQRVGHDKASVGHDKASVGHDKASASVTTRPPRWPVGGRYEERFATL